MRHLKGLTNLVVLDLFAAKVSDIGCGYIRYLCTLPDKLSDLPHMDPLSLLTKEDTNSKTQAATAQ